MDFGGSIRFDLSIFAQINLPLEALKNGEKVRQ